MAFFVTQYLSCERKITISSLPKVLRTAARFPCQKCMIHRENDIKESFHNKKDWEPYTDIIDAHWDKDVK